MLHGLILLRVFSVFDQNSGRKIENTTSKGKSLIYRNALSLSFGRPLLMSCRRCPGHTFHKIIQYRKFCSDREETHCYATEITWPAFWAVEHHQRQRWLPRFDERRAEIREKNIRRVEKMKKKNEKIALSDRNQIDSICKKSFVLRSHFLFFFFLLFGKWQITLHLVMCSGYRDYYYLPNPDRVHNAAQPPLKKLLSDVWSDDVRRGSGARVIRNGMISSFYKL